MGWTTEPGELEKPPAARTNCEALTVRRFMDALLPATSAKELERRCKISLPSKFTNVKVTRSDLKK